MDFDLQNVQQRLIALLDGRQRLVFWEDPEGDYAEALDKLQLPGVEIVDASSRELATKRLVLRERPEARFLIYRSGPIPPREDDFLYDIKLASVGFSCEVEAIWAEECRIGRRFQDFLSQHADFFAEKSRREKLAAIQLPRESESELSVAMIAACANLPADTDNERDAIRDTLRKLLVEYAEQKDELAGRKHPTIGALLQKSDLMPAFWDAVERIFGYRAPQGESPSIADLALRMLITAAGPLMPEGVQTLNHDAVRVLEDLCHGDAREQAAYEVLVDKEGHDVAELVPAELRNPDAIGDVTLLPVFDEWTLSTLAKWADAGSLSSAQLRGIVEQRREGHWFKDFRSHYEALGAAVELFEQEQLFRAELSSARGPEALFGAYCDHWHLIDRDYRRFCRAWHALPADSRFRQSLEGLHDRLEGTYDRFLADLAERWQRPLELGEAYPPADLPSQRDFFAREVLLASPRAERGKRVGVIVSDALRYEVGKQLAGRLNASYQLKGRVKADCEGMLAMLPSYTQLGMAALLPDGPMHIDPADLMVEKDSAPTQGLANRQKALERALPGSLALPAKEVLRDGLPDVSAAPLVYIYHDAIDARGDDAGTESQVFDACEDALDELVKLVVQLVRAGCGRVLVTADHGFLYQDEKLPEREFVDLEDLQALAAQESVDFSHKDRFIVGDLAPSHESLIRCTPSQLSLEGSGRIAFPRGITRLRQRGSGKQYVHGGDTLQECAVPLVRLRVVKGREAAQPVGVQGYISGRPLITGTSFALDVYQEQPCDDLHTPLSVKVGIYAPDDVAKNPGKLLCESEQRLELDSEADEVESRKTHLRLRLTDDVDDYSDVCVRILARKGDTNQYGRIWERELGVRRAFGSDF